MVWSVRLLLFSSLGEGGGGVWWWCLVTRLSVENCGIGCSCGSHHGQIVPLLKGGLNLCFF